jgi:tetratricopeptide (TPR) repeat protein
MNANRITRREALAAGVGALAAAHAAAAPAPKDGGNTSWVGKVVMPRRFALAVPLPEEDEAAPRRVVVLDAASYAVKGERDETVAVFDALGTAHWVEKKDLVLLSDAVELFTAALKANEKDRFALVSRGWAQYLLGRPDRAVADFDAFLRLVPAGTAAGPATPARWEGLVNRGLVLAERGEFEKALADLDEAVKDFPAVTIARVNRGYARELMGEYEKALADYRGTQHLLAANNYAWLRATCPDEKIRDAAEAEKYAKSACGATRDREGMFLDTLAAAHAAAGKFDEAVKAQEKALADPSFAARHGDEARARLRLYKAKRPYRTEPVKKK